MLQNTTTPTRMTCRRAPVRVLVERLDSSHLVCAGDPHDHLAHEVADGAVREHADPIGPSRRPVWNLCCKLIPCPSVARANLSNGAALYRDSVIPWAIEAAARQAVEEVED